MSPLTFLHISAGTVGLIAGALSMIFKKGSDRHRVAGNVFFGAMIFMSLSAAYLAAVKTHKAMEVLNGLLTFYLVMTGWLAGRRRDGKTSTIDRALFAVGLGIGVTHLAFGFQGPRGGYPAGMYFVFGTITLLCATSDLKMLIRGAVVGAKRIVRHLWRMGFALWIATTSLFLGQPQAFPEPVRKSGVLMVPVLLLTGSLIYWLCRFRFKRTRQLHSQTYSQ